MFCCRGPPPVEEDRPLIVDLHKIFTDLAWKTYRYSSFGYFARKCLHRKDFEIEVPENYFSFDQVSQTIEQGGKIEFNFEETEPNLKEAAPAAKNLLEGRRPTNTNLTSPEIVSLDTEFENKTAKPHTYNFKFQKTRRTDMNVTFQKGFTIGGKARFNVGLPKLLSDGSLGLETQMQYQVTKTEGEKYEESMLMEATSDITVGPNRCYTANVQLEEKSVAGKFTIVMRMSLPQGKAPVYIRRKSDNQQVYVYYISNLKEIFTDDNAPCAKKVKEGSGFAIDKMDFVVEGLIKGTLACNHKIKLSSNETEEERAYARKMDMGAPGVEDTGAGEPESRGVHSTIN